MIRLVERAFDPGAELNAFCAGRSETGAVASFIGLARGEVGAATALELQAYPGFTEAGMAEMANAASQRFDLQDVSIVHRIGRIPPGEAIVLVLTAASHRRAAFQACDYLMDALKSRAALWKKEHGRGGELWIEPTAADAADLARWRPKADDLPPPFHGEGRAEAEVGKSAQPLATPTIPTSPPRSLRESTLPKKGR